VLAVLSYGGIAAACDDVPRLLHCEPSAIELIPRSIVQLAKSVPAYASQAAILDMEGEALLVLEFSGDDPALLRKAAIALHPAVIAESPEDQKRIWSVRKVGLGLLASRTGSAKTAAFIEDCAIPVDHLGDFVRGVQAILREYGADAEFYAHASAGCLHIRPILDLKQQHRELRGIAQAVLQLTLSLHGSMSSEHGDGLARSEWLRETYGPELMDAFRAFKQAADPHGILNPGKILDAPPMDANLRFSRGYETRVWDAGFDFSREDGLAGAVEQCNGQGVCRKFDGTMCPSFQATREEMHSTRGRANLLRALISRPGLAGIEQDAYAALDLCLACKGCKSECPSGVDMAKLKFSFLAQYHKTHSRPLRDYIFGYFHTVSSLLAPVAPIANALMRFGPTRRLIAGITGITSKRPFPVYSMKRARVQKAEGPAGGRVLFLSDAFTHFVEPEIEQAAFDLLAFAGYQVIKLPYIGAGASLISKGFIPSSRKHAARLLDAIRELDPAGTMMVIGLEPPDIYALKNDFAALLPGRAREAVSVSARTWLLDEFLIRSTGLEKLRIVIMAGSSVPARGHKVHFQPHCHQRAEPPADDGLPSGTAATIALLKACGFDAEAIDSGCCGMAGTFGYEKEHYDLSVSVGKLKLFPAIQQGMGSDPGATFLSTGSACRMQIEQGTTARAEHPVAFLRRHLPPRVGRGL
jgi:Fe-S oxidoreductase